MRGVKYIDVDEDRVALKKTGTGYRVIQPWKNEDKSINWFNVLTGGSWANLILVFIFVVIILGAVSEYASNINALLDCFRVPGQLEICQEAFTPKGMRLYG